MNFIFQRRTDLALAAIRVLASSEGRVPGSALAEDIDTTVTYLPQVMAPLIGAGLVESDRGPRGGYSLAVDPAELRLLDVIELTEGDGRNGRCVMRDAPCPGDEPCEVHTAFSAAREVLVDQLSAIPLVRGNSQGGRK